MSELESDLKATRDDLIADAERLKQIEVEKASLAADDPRMEVLSREAEALVRRMVPKAVAERELAEGASDG